ncbi:hypothetical protein ACQP1G_12830 [Nocardia sp. CA-107356]|uniref:hypothetical protein n=1 Tax=Nocardia sp. CA-107356 TaxID=3239972 RepID=UPI003D8A01E7
MATTPGGRFADVRDPQDPHIVGYYIPDNPKQRLGPVPTPLVHQAQDVIDRRNIIYMSESNSGIHILAHH